MDYFDSLLFNMQQIQVKSKTGVNSSGVLERKIGVGGQVAPKSKGDPALDKAAVRVVHIPARATRFPRYSHTGAILCRL